MMKMDDVNVGGWGSGRMLAVGIVCRLPRSASCGPPTFAMLNTIYNVLWHRLQALVISSLARTNIVISSTYIVTHRDTSRHILNRSSLLPISRQMFTMFKIFGDILRQRDVAVLSPCCVRDTSCWARVVRAVDVMTSGSDFRYEIFTMYTISTCLTRGQYVDKEQNTSFTRL